MTDRLLGSGGRRQPPPPVTGPVGNVTPSQLGFPEYGEVSSAGAICDGVTV